MDERRCGRWKDNRIGREDRGHLLGVILEDGQAVNGYVYDCRTLCWMRGRKGRCFDSSRAGHNSEAGKATTGPDEERRAAVSFSALVELVVDGDARDCAC